MGLGDRYPAGAVAELKDLFKSHKNKYLDGMFESYKVRRKSQRRKRIKQETLKEVYLYYVDDVDEGIEEKHAIMADIREKLGEWDTADTYRSPKQIELHHEFLSTCACMVYGERYYNDEYMPEILERNGWDREDVFFLFSSTMPRRFGKTWAIAMYVIICLICIPRCEVSIFAPSENQAVTLKNFIRDKLRAKFPGWNENKDTKREYWIELDETDIRKVHAWPSGTKVSRVRVRYSFFFLKVLLFFFYSFIHLGVPLGHSPSGFPPIHPG